MKDFRKERERTDLTVSSGDTEKYSQQKLADKFKVSQPKISQDLQLAEALKKYPTIEKCRTKKGALHKLRQNRIERKPLTLIFGEVFTYPSAFFFALNI